MLSERVEQMKVTSLNRQKVGITAEMGIILVASQGFLVECVPIHHSHLVGLLGIGGRRLAVKKVPSSEDSTLEREVSIERIPHSQIRGAQSAASRTQIEPLE